MPIRTERVKTVSLVTLKKSRLQQQKKKKKKEKQISDELLKKMELDYFGIPNKKQLKHDNAKNISNDIKINNFEKFIFYTIDYLNPLIIKHPKFGNKIIKLSEKIIKLNSKIIKDIQKK